MTQEPKQKSSRRRYTGALAVPLKPQQKYKRPHSLRHLRRLGAKASGAPAPSASFVSSNSTSGLHWDFGLKPLLPSGQSGVAGADPIVTPIPPIFSDSMYSVAGWRWEFDQKFLLLLEHYGIERDDPIQLHKLCLGLAIAHVPGFQERVSRKKGRPRDVSLQEEQGLYARFCALQQDGHSDRNAARLMAKELGKSGRAGSEASILRRMQRRKQMALAASNSLDASLAGLTVTQNSVP